MFNKQNFIKGIFMIAIPIIIQQVISLSLNMIDTFMIGSVGINELAAVGAANKVYFIFGIVCFGIYSGATIYVSQYYGIKDINSIKKVMAIELWIGFILSCIVMFFTYIFAPQILNLFTNDQTVIHLGVTYLRIAFLTYLPISISFAYSFNSRSIHKLKFITLVSVFAILCNTLLNYLLIFGNFSFPKLGVSGAAIATLIARLLELTFIIIYIYFSDNHPLAVSINHFKKIDTSLLKKIFKTALPVVASESAWSIGTTTCFIAYGLLGTSALAVVQVASSINDLFQCIFFGIGNASAVMIGNELGRNNKDLAYTYGKLFIFINVFLCLITSTLLFLLKDNIASIYQYDSSTTNLLTDTLTSFAIFNTPKMMTYVLICGILRSGGDTKFCMLCDMIGIWGIAVPLSFIGVLVFKLPLPLVVAISFSDEIFKCLITFYRFISKKWIHNLIEINN